MIEAMATLHITEAELARDIHAVLAKVQAGAEIVVEQDHRPVAVIRSLLPKGRLLSECIALAEAHEKESGQSPVLDSDFAEDVKEIVRNRRPWNPPTWD
jgi:hypothetical protein